jgi:hypothetical protein
MDVAAVAAVVAVNVVAAAVVVVVVVVVFVVAVVAVIPVVVVLVVAALVVVVVTVVVACGRAHTRTASRAGPKPSVDDDENVTSVLVLTAVKFIVRYTQLMLVGVRDPTARGKGAKGMAKPQSEYSGTESNTSMIPLTLRYGPSAEIKRPGAGTGTVGVDRERKDDLVRLALSCGDTLRDSTADGPGHVEGACTSERLPV